MTAEIEPSLDRAPRSEKSDDLPPNHRALAEGETPGLCAVESSFCAPGGVLCRETAPLWRWTGRNVMITLLPKILQRQGHQLNPFFMPTDIPSYSRRGGRGEQITQIVTCGPKGSGKLRTDSSVDARSLTSSTKKPIVYRPCLGKSLGMESGRTLRVFPGSEFSARTVLPWNLRAQGPRRAQRLRKDANEQRDTQSGRRAALAAREARGLRVHLSQIVRKVASEARECTSEVARPRVLTPHALA